MIIAVASGTVAWQELPLPSAERLGCLKPALRSYATLASLYRIDDESVETSSTQTHALSILNQKKKVVALPSLSSFLTYTLDTNHIRQWKYRFTTARFGLAPYHHFNTPLGRVHLPSSSSLMPYT
ncbi:hypothetical protein LIA77_08557 [Sarocladium implicatum]|nr:hypothetical protein LIA77_08557 [Sarocladium implicatum]